MTAGDTWTDTGNGRRSGPNVGPWTRALAMGGHIRGHILGSPPWAPQFRPYVYRGTGRDELTAFMDDQPHRAEPLTRRAERMQLLAGMRLHDGPDPEPPPGVFTTAQAAEQLGVSERTVLRYRRDLTSRRAS